MLKSGNIKIKFKIMSSFVEQIEIYRNYDNSFTF